MISRALIPAALLLCACTRPNPLFCEQGDECPSGVCIEMFNACARCDCQGSAPICDDLDGSCRACDVSDECEARDPATPVCAPDGTCVQCIEAMSCPADAPICAGDSCVACEGDDECRARDPTAPVCADDGTCEACGGAADCPEANAPICDAGGACRGCAEHDECDALACDRATGACVAQTDIIYADAEAGTDAEDCGSRDMPCETLTGGQGALVKVGGDRTWVRLASGIYNEAATLSGVTVNLVGPKDAEIVPPSNPSDVPALHVEGASEVLVHGLTLRNAVGDLSGHGIQCDNLASDRPSLTLRGVAVKDNSASGLRATGCDLSLTRSVISQNDGGGVRLENSSFTLQNNFIVQNGTAGVAGTPFGGVRIENTGSFGDQLLEHNTLADNQANDGADSHGIECTTTEPTIARSNIVYDGVGGAAAVAGSCTHVFSDIEGVEDADGNLDEPPLFENPGAGNYHLQAGSPCIDKADPASELTEDLDGEGRPQGDGPDIGADEVQ